MVNLENNENAIVECSTTLESLPITPPKYPESGYVLTEEINFFKNLSKKQIKHIYLGTDSPTRKDIKEGIKVVDKFELLSAGLQKTLISLQSFSRIPDTQSIETFKEGLQGRLRKAESYITELIKIREEISLKSSSEKKVRESFSATLFDEYKDIILTLQKIDKRFDKITENYEIELKEYNNSMRKLDLLETQVFDSAININLNVFTSEITNYEQADFCYSTFNIDNSYKISSDKSEVNAAAEVKNDERSSIDNNNRVETIKYINKKSEPVSISNQRIEEIIDTNKLKILETNKVSKEKIEEEIKFLLKQNASLEKPTFWQKFTGLWSSKDSQISKNCKKITELQILLSNISKDKNNFETTILNEYGKKSFKINEQTPKSILDLTIPTEKYGKLPQFREMEKEINPHVVNGNRELTVNRQIYNDTTNNFDNESLRLKVSAKNPGMYNIYINGVRSGIAWADDALKIAKAFKAGNQITLKKKKEEIGQGYDFHTILPPLEAIHEIFAPYKNPYPLLSQIFTKRSLLKIKS